MEVDAALPLDSEPSSSKANPIAGGYVELLAIAVPMVLSSSTQSMMHVVDRVFMTWYSKEAVAAALPAGILFWSCLSLPFGIVSYANAFVAQYDGAKQPARVAMAVWQATYFALACGLLLIPCAAFSELLFNLVGHEASIRSLEAEYFSWLALGAVFSLLPAALSCFYSGRGQTRMVLLVNASSVLVNAGLDAVFIFGWGPFPRLGMAGAAIATNLANAYATVCYLLLLSRTNERETYQFWKNCRFDRGLMGDLLKFGGPSGLQMFLDVAGFTAFIMIIGWIGKHELAATNIAFNLNTLAFTPVIGVGIAVSTLVGQRIGEGRPDIAEKSVRKGFVVAGGIMALCGAFYVLAPQILLAPYAYRAEGEDFAAVRDVVIVLLRFVALYSFFDAMAIVFGSAVRAAGDTTFSMLATCLCAWGLLVLPTYLTWKYHGPSLFWSWIWCTVYVTVLGFVFYFRFIGGRWKTMNLIHHESPPLAETHL
jgi:multidrug resistance protein, MATE family